MDATPDEAGQQAGSQYVQSLARGLAVIRAFDADTPVMRLSDVARRTGLTRATARRFLLTLVELGYVRSDGKQFALTARVLELGYSYLSALSLPEIIQPHLEELMSIVHESTSACVLDGYHVTYVARVPARRIMSVGISIGTRFPAYATSMGRVLLAYLPPDELERHLNQAELKPLTDRTIVKIDQLEQELARVRAQGWCMVDQELEIGLRSIAVPLSDASGRVIAAINVSGRASEGDVDDFRSRFLEPLQSAASKMRVDLSASKPISTLLV